MIKINKFINVQAKLFENNLFKSLFIVVDPAKIRKWNNYDKYR